MTESPQSKLLAILSSPWLISGLFIAVLLACPRIAALQEKVNPTGALVKGFLDRVNTYVNLKKKLEAGLTPLSPSDRTSGVQQHQTELAQRIRTARRGAKPGDDRVA